jgi:hypothetical protein
VAAESGVTRATVIHELGKLRQELRAARSMDSPNREDIVRRRIDRKLEDLYGCMDPAGVADPGEWGAGG